NLVDVIVDSDTEIRYQVSTILDMTGATSRVTRQGQGWEEAIAWGAELEPQR
ncbi:MAG: threonylcarbamoyl-AMP synthase, partial [Cyanobacteria bacterium J06554_3]